MTDQPIETPRTVRVRVAVAVNARGNLFAHVIGDAFGDDYYADTACLIVSKVHGGATLASIIEADIPLPPSPETVAGEVAP